MSITCRRHVEYLWTKSIPCECRIHRPAICAPKPRLGLGQSVRDTALKLNKEQSSGPLRCVFLNLGMPHECNPPVMFCCGAALEPRLFGHDFDRGSSKFLGCCMLWTKGAPPLLLAVRLPGFRPAAPWKHPDRNGLWGKPQCSFPLPVSRWAMPCGISPY